MLSDFAKCCRNYARFWPNVADFLPEFHIRFQKLSKSNLELRKFADLIRIYEKITENRAEKVFFS